MPSLRALFRSGSRRAPLLASGVDAPQLTPLSSSPLCDVDTPGIPEAAPFPRAVVKLSVE